jgi:aminoglycoside/choline kinase family phosphotransferase
VRLERLAGDGSDRRYWRARYRADGVERSLVVMDLVGVKNVVASEEVTLYHPEGGELPFLNIHRFLTSVGVPVPRVIAHRVDEGWVLLEDLGDELLLNAAEDPRRRRPLYEQAIDILASLHVEGTRRMPADCMAGRQGFAFDLLMWEFRHYTEYGLEKSRVDPVRLHAEEIVALESVYRLVAEHLSGLPRVLTHRDYHSRNLLVTPDGLAVIDFQDALMGPAAYDLASLLRDSYIDIGTELVDALIERYVSAREAAGDGPIDRAAFRRDFDWQALQRNLKAIGRFGFFDVVKGRPQFLADIPRTYGYVKTTLSRYEELAPMARVLARHRPEWEGA